VNAAKRSPEGLSPLYCRLRKLDICIDLFNFKKIVIIFSLPSLRELALHGVDRIDRGDYHDLPENLIDTSPVTSLTLTNFDMGVDTFVYLIAVCRELQEFVNIYYQCDEDAYFTRIAGALQKHKKTLRKLRLENESGENGLEDVDGTLGSLKDFHNLTHFCAPIGALQWNDEPPPDSTAAVEDFDSFVNLAAILPKSLRHLALNILEDEEDYDTVRHLPDAKVCAESLRILAKTYRQDFPLLRAIEVKAFKEVKLSYVRVDEFFQKFWAGGVTLDITREGLLARDIKEFDPDESDFSDSYEWEYDEPQWGDDLEDEEDDEDYSNY
jgi:hypothetical protein